MTRDEPLFKTGISLDLQILGNFWDNVSTQPHEIYHTVQVVFEYFITKILHNVPLRPNIMFILQSSKLSIS